MSKILRVFSLLKKAERVCATRRAQYQVGYNSVRHDWDIQRRYCTDYRWGVNILTKVEVIVVKAYREGQSVHVDLLTIHDTEAYKCKCTFIRDCVTGEVAGEYVDITHKNSNLELSIIDWLTQEVEA